MQSTAKRDVLDELRADLEKIAQRFPTDLEQKVRDLLTAAEYNDATLIDSSLIALYDAMASVVRDIIKRELENGEAAIVGLKRGWKEYADGCVLENFDELKEVIDSTIDERISKMLRVRDLVKMLAKKGHEVENAQPLDDGIRGLRRFRENMLKDWPAPCKPPSPLNHSALAEARAAFNRGEKGMRKDELVWGNGPTKKSG